MNHRDTEIEDGIGIAQEELMSNNKHTQDLERALEASQSRVESLEAALRDVLESENSTQYGKPNGVHERDCSSVQDYKRVIPCDCVWGRARLSLTNDAGEGA